MTSSIPQINFRHFFTLVVKYYQFFLFTGDHWNAYSSKMIYFTDIANQNWVFTFYAIGYRLLLNIPKIQCWFIHSNPLIWQLKKIYLISIIFIGYHFFCREFIIPLPKYNSWICKYCPNSIGFFTISHRDNCNVFIHFLRFEWRYL